MVHPLPSPKERLNGFRSVPEMRIRRQHSSQMVMDFRPDPRECLHEGLCYKTQACVPSGVFCDTCKSVVYQRIVPIDEPETLGYVSAEWAWRHRKGRPWTTQLPGGGFGVLTDDASSDGGES